MTHADENPKTGSLTRKGLKTFQENPFLKNALTNTNEGMRRVNMNKDGSQMMMVDKSTGAETPAGFWHIQEVDRTQFVKLYINGVKAFTNLSSAGTKVFELIYLAVQKSIGSDTVLIVFNRIDQQVTPISRTTFQKGMKEACVKGFLAETDAPGLYFINPDFIFNGDRLAVVKEYRLRRDEIADAEWDRNRALTNANKGELT